jgi:1-deoxy-D-xylulose-5-phosphate reductoisomerase
LPEKRVAILGSTGSIGVAALDVVRHLGSPFRVTAISAHKSADKLIEQLDRHGPAAVAITGGEVPDALRAACKSRGASLLTGPDALVEIVNRDDVDVVLNAVVGAAGLPASLAAVNAGKPLLLANKESLVVAGRLLIDAARDRGVPILPIDSEHSAVFQAIQCGRRDEIRRVILTASGGPFRTWPVDKIDDATPADALKHPTWRMGGKITIDSATMFNKSLEVIEACWLFDLPVEQVDVVIHPESIVHSMVEFVDGSTLAQLSPPDMKMPIQYALTYPHRKPGLARAMDWSKRQVLHFDPPDLERYPALRLGYDAARAGGTTLAAALNAANEVAVDAFLSGKIRFGAIWRTVEQTMKRHAVQALPTMADLLEADRWARAETARAIADCPLPTAG